MKKRVLPVLLCLLLLALAVFLLLDQTGSAPLHGLFSPANKEEHFPEPQGNSSVNLYEGETAPSALQPGTYYLTAAEAPDFTLSGELISAIRRLGIPLELEVNADGTAALRIFDRNWVMTWDAEQLFFLYQNESLPFSFRDGILTLWDGEIRLNFEWLG